jgi:hypothetical protein
MTREFNYLGVDWMTQKIPILSRKMKCIDIRSCREQEYSKKRRKALKGKTGLIEMSSLALLIPIVVKSKPRS